MEPFSCSFQINWELEIFSILFFVVQSANTIHLLKCNPTLFEFADAHNVDGPSNYIIVIGIDLVPVEKQNSWSQEYVMEVAAHNTR